LRDNGGFLPALVGFIDRLNEVVGRWTSWLILSMVLTTFLVAVLRYGVGVGWIWLQETYVWMHGAIIMLAAGYTLLHDGHVRVDIFYRSASIRFKAWVNLLGVIFFLMPMLAIVWWGTWPYVLLSWHRLEESREAGGMHGLYLWKTTMLVFCILLALQGISLAIRSAFILMNRPDPDSVPDQGQTGM
jgi:TRAP-type mannitol/chloroaromatic compound transport system permease small subunit